jgi:hypothetical protein
MFTDAAFEGRPLGNGFFTAMMDPNGSLLWYKPSLDYPYPMEAGSEDIATDWEDNIYVLGSTSAHGFRLDSTHIIPDATTSRYFLIKYDKRGNIAWLRMNDEAHRSFAYQLGVDFEGNIHVVGYFDSLLLAGGMRLSSNGRKDGFVATYALDGTLRGLLGVGGPGDDAISGIVEGMDGMIYITGTAAPSARFGDLTLEKGGAYAALCSVSGRCTFVVSGYPVSPNSRAEGNRIAVTREGNIYVTGIARNRCLFDPFPIDGGGAGNSYLARLFGPNATAVESTTASPGNLVLHTGFPNPFSGATTLGFALPSRTSITLDIMNACGKRIRRLVDGDYAAGSHAVVWDAAACPTGVYFAVLRSANASTVRAMILR